MQPDDRPGLIERLSVAMTSSHLAMKDGRCDLDFIIALGLAAQERPEISHILHLHLAATPEAYQQAERSAIAITRRLDGKRNWRLASRTIVWVAKKALKHYICPVCPACSGRRFETTPGTPVLSARACGRCRGTGINPLPMQHGRVIAEVVARLEAIEDVAERAVRAKFTKEIAS